jgi:pimeloyl-ACP methyl ester carboxylesterase
MALAAQAGTPVRKLVLNEAGPLVARAALERIAGYLGKPVEFQSIEDAEAYVRIVAEPFGPHSDAEWRFLTDAWVARGEDGRWRPRYDPRIAEAFRAGMPEKGKDLDLWALYDAVRCPTLVLRGARSDLLARDTAAEMRKRGPNARVVEIPGVGHAPTLLHQDQIALVRDFLLDGGSS